MDKKLIDVLNSFMVDDDCLSNEKIAEILIAHDIVPVVRCKDCKHWTMGYCNHFAYYSYEPITSEDDFCSYGERRPNV